MNLRRWIIVAVWLARVICAVSIMSVFFSIGSLVQGTKELVHPRLHWFNHAVASLFIAIVMADVGWRYFDRLKVQRHWQRAKADAFRESMAELGKRLDGSETSETKN